MRTGGGGAVGGLSHERLRANDDKCCCKTCNNSFHILFVVAVRSLRLPAMHGETPAPGEKLRKKRGRPRHSLVMPKVCSNSVENLTISAVILGVCCETVSSIFSRISGR